MSATRLSDLWRFKPHIRRNEIVDMIGLDEQISWHVLGAVVLCTIRAWVSLALAVHRGPNHEL